MSEAIVASIADGYLDWSMHSAHDKQIPFRTGSMLGIEFAKRGCETVEVALYIWLNARHHKNAVGEQNAAILGRLGNFNDGQYEAAAQLRSQAQQICVVLYPKDAAESGKFLWLKQFFFYVVPHFRTLLLDSRRGNMGAYGNGLNFPTR